MLPFPHALAHRGRDYLSRTAHRRSALSHVQDRQTGRSKEAKKAAVQRSRSVLSGMFAEQLAPYLPNFPFSPTEAKFIGALIDFLVFKGMDAQHIEEVIFVEVKSGSARLNHNEHSLKEAIDNKRVRWHEYRVPTPVTHSDTATESAL
jgi:predicted Holliday junction resolvase-like endonuclease